MTQQEQKWFNNFEDIGSVHFFAIIKSRCILERIKPWNLCLFRNIKLTNNLMSERLISWNKISYETVNIKCWPLQPINGNSIRLEKTGSPFEKKGIALGLALKIQHILSLKLYLSREKYFLEETFSSPSLLSECLKLLL